MASEKSGADGDRQRFATRLHTPWFLAFLFVSQQRRAVVLEDITQGSAPRPIYYVLMGLSVLLAGFGLLADSPAVVIGAMLVSPLMTPIFGMAIGIARGDLKLFREASIAEFGGVVLAILVAFLLGVLPFSLEATPEMLARTSPTLLDLFVAALAGLAGCLTMIDERTSAALPGVAIATALTPPLATSGLCLAFGAYAGAWGAFLLFFANFLAMLTVATAIFIIAGFVTKEEIGSARQFLRRFAAAGVGLALVTVLLTVYLVRMIQEFRTQQAVTAVLVEALADDPTTTVDWIDFNRENGRLAVLSHILTRQVLSPKKVKEIETAIGERLEEDVDLYFRCNITTDVTSTGSASLRVQRNLDGTFTQREPSREARTLQLAEQTVREILVALPNIMLIDIDLVRLQTRLVVVVTVESSRPPVPSEVRKAELAIQERLDDPNVRLLVRTISSIDISAKGRVLLGGAHFGEQRWDVDMKQRTIEAKAKERIERLPNLFANSVDAVKEEEKWVLRAEVVGPRVLSVKEVRTIEQALEKDFGEPVELTVWARSEYVVTSHGYDSFDTYAEGMESKTETP